ncbi:MAG: hypothetical protein KDD43_07095, partial [Bdellovibrionales bacterium]|nr:hypothetical protein [Bdellovibrionales bacterium]
MEKSIFFDKPECGGKEIITHLFIEAVEYFQKDEGRLLQEVLLESAKVAWPAIKKWPNEKLVRLFNRLDEYINPEDSEKDKKSKKGGSSKRSFASNYILFFDDLKVWEKCLFVA